MPAVCDDVALRVASLLLFLEGRLSAEATPNAPHVLVRIAALSTASDALAIAGLYRESGTSAAVAKLSAALTAAPLPSAKTAALIVRGSASLFERAALTEVEDMLRKADMVTSDTVSCRSIAAAVKMALRQFAPLLGGDRAEWISAASLSAHDGGVALRARLNALPLTARWLIDRIVAHAAALLDAQGGATTASLAITVCSNLMEGGSAIPPSPTAHDEVALVIDALLALANVGTDAAVGGSGANATHAVDGVRRNKSAVGAATELIGVLRVASLASSIRGEPPALVRDCCAFIEEAVATARAAPQREFSFTVTFYANHAHNLTRSP
jgi:hypothetical protein